MDSGGFQAALAALLLLLTATQAKAESACPSDMAAAGRVSCIDRFEAPNREGERPFTGKTAPEGEAWCGLQGKLLCTEDQWMEACEGEEHRPFPYGHSYEKSRCVDEKTWIPPNWGAIASYPAEAGKREIERLNQSEPAGSREGCATPEGVMDLTGNTAEWVLATRPHPNGHRHVMKGCYWSGCYGGSAPRFGFTNPAHPGGFRTYEAGFRCCSPRPQTLPAALPAAGPQPAFACDPTVHPAPNAGLSEAPGDPGCPDGMARIGAGASGPFKTFCMDRYEASLVELTPEGERPWSPFHNPGPRKVRAVALEGAVPQGYINGLQAAAACAASGKRLCTSSEWLRACSGKSGPGGRIYPYGNTRRPGACQDARAKHPAVELFPGHPNPFSMIQHACLNQLPSSLARTGSHPECMVPEGAYDLMGNLHEWVADEAGTFRGGFYVDTKINGEGCRYVTTAHTRPHWDYSTGFRCCAEL
ncbi:MAG: SUMF1/EgtB/PvdO family nonheme iron enzyme [Bdellovibrionales bacterium]|nr:SUMF1/EgtB/PvdO family nonheme iron enzyme [Bdellovibrionales bacterium]